MNDEFKKQTNDEFKKQIKIISNAIQYISGMLDCIDYLETLQPKPQHIVEGKIIQFTNLTRNKNQ